MREILFRGKEFDSEKWVEGGIVQTENWTSIFTVSDFEGTYWEPPSSELNEVGVMPETVGQFTGLTDKKGKKIYEGDICHFYGGLFYGGSWEANHICAIEINNECLHYLENAENVEVIGNIYDNPELLNKPVGNSDQLEVKND